MAGNEKRMNPADSAGIDGAIEGQSTTENYTNKVSRATRAVEQAKQKQIAATKQAETALVVEHLPSYHQLHDLLIGQLS